MDLLGVRAFSFLLALPTSGKEESRNVRFRNDDVGERRKVAFTGSKRNMYSLFQRKGIYSGDISPCVEAQRFYGRVR
jgi:hypothetical protein